LARGAEAHVIHASSVAVSREHRRAKTDRLDTELLKRGFLGWLRGKRGHCSMARVPTIAEEDAKRPNRERDCLVGERGGQPSRPCRASAPTVKSTLRLDQFVVSSHAPPSNAGFP
jgi:transposase